MAQTRRPRTPRTRTRSHDSTSDPSSLGMVVRFQAKAGATGIRQLQSAGFNVASSSEFRRAAAVPNDFDGADVQYFERFGVAIVRGDGERLRPALARAAEQRVLSAARPERRYRALGAAGAALAPLQAEAAASIGEAAMDVNYLRGYRDAVDHLVSRLAAAPATARAAKASFAETVATWGLQAANVTASALTGKGIRIAVLDTGFDDTHQDFLGRKVKKKVFVSKSSPDDVIGHGTHCIGTACGPLHPVKGPRYGIACEAEIYAGKVLGDDGYGTDRSIIAGMDWAVENGCHVISMSLGALVGQGDQPSDEYEHIGQVCLDAGSLVIAAAGNDSGRPGIIEPVNSPANASTIMAVGAVDRSLGIAPFSCGGLNPDQNVDLVAPGMDVLSCLPGDRYDRWDGTSMATPHVAGIAALIAQSDSKYRGWALWARLMQLVRRLELSARDVGEGLVQAPVG